MANGHSSLTLCHSNSMKNIIGMKFLMLSYTQYYCYFALSLSFALSHPLLPFLSFALPLSLSLLRSPQEEEDCSTVPWCPWCGRGAGWGVGKVLGHKHHYSASTSTTTLQAKTQAPLLCKHKHHYSASTSISSRTQAQAQAHRHKLTSASTNTKANKHTTNSSKAQAHKHKHASTSINTQVHGQKHGNGAQT